MRADAHSGGLEDRPSGRSRADRHSRQDRLESSAHHLRPELAEGASRMPPRSIQKWIGLAKAPQRASADAVKLIQTRRPTKVARSTIPPPTCWRARAGACWPTRKADDEAADACGSDPPGEGDADGDGLGEGEGFASAAGEGEGAPTTGAATGPNSRRPPITPAPATKPSRSARKTISRDTRGGYSAAGSRRTPVRSEHGHPRRPLLAFPVRWRASWIGSAPGCCRPL